MRIISGSLKGRKLAPVHGRKTRPTADRVRESLFNILGARPGRTSVLDLFAGTGALGLEALSRGAAQAVFVENSVQALGVLRKNIQQCRMQDRALVIHWDITRNLTCLQPYPRVFDLIFMDPPYGRQLICPALQYLSQSGCPAPGALLVVETSRDEVLADLPTGWQCEDMRTYGGTKLWFLDYDQVRD